MFARSIVDIIRYVNVVAVGLFECLINTCLYDKCTYHSIYCIKCDDECSSPTYSVTELY